MIPFTSCVHFRRNGQPIVAWRPAGDDRTNSELQVERRSDGIYISLIGGGSSSSNTPTSVISVISDSDRALLSTLDTRISRPLLDGRFLTMHKRRRKRLTTRQLINERALLDDIYHGPVRLVMDRIDRWRFNAFTLDNVTGGRSVPVLGTHLFKELGIIRTFQLDVVKVWKCFNLIEEGYHSTNPYHNSIHATDVTQAMYCFLKETKVREYLTPLEMMAAILAAVSHDLDHPGVNQPFLIATSNHLAALYKNASVLENHHWRMAAGCLADSGMLSHFSRDFISTLMTQIRSLILATDIARQAEFITQLKHHIVSGSLEMKNQTHRHFILQIALKSADISNPCRSWDISQKWSRKVCDEFYRQGDFERRLKLPLTTLCDRVNSSVAKIQVGFFRHVVRPLFVDWNHWLDTALSREMATNLEQNQMRWERMLQCETDEESRCDLSDDLEERSATAGSSDDVSATELRELLTVPTHCSRRHSAPVVVPRPLARTFIRRESLPPAPVNKRMRTETILHMADSDLSVASPGACLRLLEEDGEGADRSDSTSNISTEMLFANTSIASMTSAYSPSPTPSPIQLLSPVGISTNPPCSGSVSPRRRTLPVSGAAEAADSGCRDRYGSLPFTALSPVDCDVQAECCTPPEESASSLQQQQRWMPTMVPAPRRRAPLQRAPLARRNIGVSSVAQHQRRRDSAPVIRITGASSLTPPMQMEPQKLRNTPGITRNSSFSEGMKLETSGAGGTSWCAAAGGELLSCDRAAAHQLPRRRGSVPSPPRDEQCQQLAQLRLALLLRLRAALSVDTHAPPPVVHRRGSLPTDLLTICSPR